MVVDNLNSNHLKKMKIMNLPVLALKNASDINEFIVFWSKLYDYPQEHLYNEAIKKPHFSVDDIQNLFVWKNGMTLSILKQNSLDKNVKSKIEIINIYKDHDKFDLSDFFREFRRMSAVWKIFLLHIIKPTSVVLI